MPPELLLEALGRGTPLEVSIVRELTEADILKVASGAKDLPAPTSILQNLKHSHHAVARLVAQGKPDSEIHLLTGYQPTYLGRLRKDPLFCTLVAGYDTAEEFAFGEAIERMKIVGMDALETLQRRLEDEGEEVSRKELREIIKLMLLDPYVALKNAQARALPPPSSGAPQVTIQFVSTEAPRGLTIEGEEAGYAEVE